MGGLVQPPQASLLVRQHPTRGVRSQLLQSPSKSGYRGRNAGIMASNKPRAPQPASSSPPTRPSAKRTCSRERMRSSAEVSRVGAAVPGFGTDAPAPRGRIASADLFGQSDDDARGAAEVAEPEDALVLRHLAAEFGAVRRGGVVLGQLQLAMAVGGPHHRDVAPDAVESDGAVRPKAFDLPLAFQLHAELGEERDSRVQVVDDDGDVVHPLNGHLSEHKAAASRRSGVPEPVARRWWGSGG